MDEEVGGIHIHAVMNTHIENPEFAMLSVRMWPLPVEVTEGLAMHIREQVNLYLAGAGLVSGQITELSNTGKAH